MAVQQRRYDPSNAVEGEAAGRLQERCRIFRRCRRVAPWQVRQSGMCRSKACPRPRKARRALRSEIPARSASSAAVSRNDIRRHPYWMRIERPLVAFLIRDQRQSDARCLYGIWSFRRERHRRFGFCNFEPAPNLRWKRLRLRTAPLSASESSW